MGDGRERSIHNKTNPFARNQPLLGGPPQFQRDDSLTVPVILLWIINDVFIAHQGQSSGAHHSYERSPDDDRSSCNNHSPGQTWEHIRLPTISNGC